MFASRRSSLSLDKLPCINSALLTCCLLVVIGNVSSVSLDRLGRQYQQQNDKQLEFSELMLPEAESELSQNNMELVPAIDGNTDMYLLVPAANTADEDHNLQSLNEPSESNNFGNVESNSDMLMLESEHTPVLQMLELPNDELETKIVENVAANNELDQESQDIKQSLNDELVTEDMFNTLTEALQEIEKENSLNNSERESGESTVEEPIETEEEDMMSTDQLPMEHKDTDADNTGTNEQKQVSEIENQNSENPEQEMIGVVMEAPNQVPQSVQDAELQEDISKADEPILVDIKSEESEMQPAVNESQELMFKEKDNNEDSPTNTVDEEIAKKEKQPVAAELIDDNVETFKIEEKIKPAYAAEIAQNVPDYKDVKSVESESLVHIEEGKNENEDSTLKPIKEEMQLADITHDDDKILTIKDISEEKETQIDEETPANGNMFTAAEPLIIGVETKSEIDEIPTKLTQGEEIKVDVAKAEADRTQVDDVNTVEAYDQHFQSEEIKEDTEAELDNDKIPFSQSVHVEGTQPVAGAVEESFAQEETDSNESDKEKQPAKEALSYNEIQHVTSTPLFADTLSLNEAEKNVEVQLSSESETLKETHEDEQAEKFQVSEERQPLEDGAAQQTEGIQMVDVAQTSDEQQLNLEFQHAEEIQQAIEEQDSEDIKQTHMEEEQPVEENQLMEEVQNIKDAQPIEETQIAEEFQNTEDVKPTEEVQFIKQNSKEDQSFEQTPHVVNTQANDAVLFFEEAQPVEVNRPYELVQSFEDLQTEKESQDDEENQAVEEPQTAEIIQVLDDPDTQSATENEPIKEIQKVENDIQSVETILEDLKPVEVIKMPTEEPLSIDETEPIVTSIEMEASAEETKPLEETHPLPGTQEAMEQQELQPAETNEIFVNEFINEEYEQNIKPAKENESAEIQNPLEDKESDILNESESTSEPSSILTTIVQVPTKEQITQLQQPVELEHTQEYPQQQPVVVEVLSSTTSKPLNVLDNVLNYVNASFINQISIDNTNNDIKQEVTNEKQSYSSKLRRYDGAQVWRIVVQNEKEKRLADELQTKYDGQLWKEVKQEVDYLLKPQVLADAALHVRAANLSRIVLIDNLQKVIEVENPPAEEIAQLQNRKGHRLTWQAYHRLEDIHGYLDYLAKTYPDICSVETIGYSIEKRPLKVLKISNGNENNPGIWIDGGIHAREWVSPAVVTYITNQIVEGWDDLPTYMRNINWYIHAVVNPDGYEYSHTTDRLWRKNMRPHGRACPGVDLNRNFGYKWGGKGTSANLCSQIYRGSTAFSEPETFYISKFITNFPRDTFKAFLTFHSYGQYILYPWGYDKHVTKDMADLDLVARQAGTIITKSTGVKYTVGSSANTLYPAAGGSDDWAKGIADIKYSYTIELGDTGRYGFILPSKFIEPNGETGLTFVDTVAKAINLGKNARRRKLKAFKTH